MPYQANSGVLTDHNGKAPSNKDLAVERENSTDNHQTPLTSSSDQSKFVGDGWSSATQELLDALPHSSTRGLLYFLVALATVVLPWSMLAKIDETSSARGRLEPKEKTIELDAAVAGKVAAIQVKEGDTVKTGQILVELESEVVRAELQQWQKRRAGQLNRLAKLELIKNQLMLALHTQQRQNRAQQLEKLAQVAQARQNFDSIKALYNLRKETKLAQVEQARQAIATQQAQHQLSKIRLATAQERFPRYELAFEEGIISQDRFLEMRQLAQESQENIGQTLSEIAQAQYRLKEQQSNYQSILHQAESELQQAWLRLKEQERGYQSLVQSGKLAVLKIEEQLKNLETEIATLSSEIAQSESQIESLEFQLNQRVLRAPASGTVFHLPIQGAGDVVQPGEMMVKIAPEGASLVLRAQMATTESGSLKVGMTVNLKFDAYPFQDYGVVEGRLSWVSPDSRKIETKQGQLEIFALEIELGQLDLDSRNKNIALTPGQTATAEVIVRQRRVIDFILDPFKKLQKGGLEL